MNIGKIKIKYKYMEKNLKYKLKLLSKINQEITVFNIPGIIISIDKENVKVRLLGNKKNTIVNIKNINPIVQKQDIIYYPMVDSVIFKYPLFKSYEHANIDPIKLNNEFIQYIKTNLMQKPSPTFLHLVNTNIFLHYFIVKNFK